MSAPRSQGKNSKGHAKRGSSTQDVAPFLRVNAEWKGYVNVEQSDATRRQHASFVADTGMVQETTAQVLLSGYKLSIVQVDNEDTVKATAYAAFAGMPDAGLSVSCWGDTIWESLAGVVFIVAIQAQLNLSQFEQPEAPKRKRTF